MSTPTAGLNITPHYIRNLSTDRIFSMDYTIDEDRILRGRIQPGALSVNLANFCTPDELNRNAQFQADRTALKVRSEAGTATGLLDIPPVPVAADIRDGHLQPKIDRITGQTVSLAGVPAAKAIVGRDLLQGQTHASVVFGSGTSRVSVFALRPGAPSNFIAVTLVDAASASVSVSGGAVTGEPSSAAPRVITVNYRGPLNSNTDDADAVAALINASAVANRLVRATGGGAGAVTASAAANLSGGVGTGFKAFIGGVEQNVQGTAGVTATSLPLQTIGIPGANGDRSNLYVISNGLRSNDFPIDVVT